MEQAIAMSLAIEDEQIRAMEDEEEIMMKLAMELSRQESETASEVQKTVELVDAAEEVK